MSNRCLSRPLARLGVGLLLIVVGSLPELHGSGPRPPDPAGDPPASPGAPAPSAASRPPPLPPSSPDAFRGAAIFRSSCAECHGQGAEGVPGRGAALRSSSFLRSRSDGALLELIRKGRSPGDPDHRGPARMPARGGNVYLPEERIRDVIAYLRWIQ